MMSSLSLQGPPAPGPTRYESPMSSGDERDSADGRERQDSPDENVSPTTANAVDPLVTRTAERIAAAINDFKRDLDQRDSVWGTASGTFELALNTDGSQVYELTIVHDAAGEEFPVTIRARPKKGKETGSSNGHNPAFAPQMAAANTSTNTKTMRRNSDAELERDLVSRKKRKLNDPDATSRKRARTDDDSMDDTMPRDDDDDMMGLITKRDLEDLFIKLREDIQDDTTSSVNHVHRLLRRFKEEWHEKCRLDEEKPTTQPSHAPFRDSITASTPNPNNPQANGVAFPSPALDTNDQNSSTADVVRREARLLSSQIRWVEDCRRVAATIHEKREENWRTTSAGFHDRNRQDRVEFQNRMLHESGIQGKMLHQILNEVKTIGLYTQSMKWETPDFGAHAHQTYPHQPQQLVTPAFPTQPPPQPPQPSRGPTSGRGRGLLGKK